MPRKTKQELADIARANGAAPKPELVYQKAPVQKYVEPNSFDISELYSSRARYSAEQKLQAVTAYVMTGTVRGATHLTGLKHQLISDWKNNSTWWPEAYAQTKKMKQEEADGVMTSIIHLAANETLDRILHGDEIVTKDGDVVRRKMGGKELATTMAITFDKRALIRGEPTSRSEKVDTASTMEHLKEEFAKMAKDALTSTVIDVTPKNE